MPWLLGGVTDKTINNWLKVSFSVEFNKTIPIRVSLWAKMLTIVLKALHA
jgi:hypothetical protein